MTVIHRGGIPSSGLLGPHYSWSSLLCDQTHTIQNIERIAIFLRLLLQPCHRIARQVALPSFDIARLHFSRNLV